MDPQTSGEGTQMAVIKSPEKRLAGGTASKHRRLNDGRALRELRKLSERNRGRRKFGGMSVEN
jgi:hypothetical protein